MTIKKMARHLICDRLATSYKTASVVMDAVVAMSDADVEKEYLLLKAKMQDRLEEDKAIKATEMVAIQNEIDQYE